MHWKYSAPYRRRGVFAVLALVGMVAGSPAADSANLQSTPPYSAWLFILGAAYLVVGGAVLAWLIPDHPRSRSHRASRLRISAAVAALLFGVALMLMASSGVAGSLWAWMDGARVVGGSAARSASAAASSSWGRHAEPGASAAGGLHTVDATRPIIRVELPPMPPPTIHVTVPGGDGASSFLLLPLLAIGAMVALATAAVLLLAKEATGPKSWILFWVAIIAMLFTAASVVVGILGLSKSSGSGERSGGGGAVQPCATCCAASGSGCGEPPLPASSPTAVPRAVTIQGFPSSGVDLSQNAIDQLCELAAGIDGRPQAITLIGAHDETQLTPASRAKLYSNESLAFSRAVAVRNALQQRCSLNVHTFVLLAAPPSRASGGRTAQDDCLNRSVQLVAGFKPDAFEQPTIVVDTGNCGK